MIKVDVFTRRDDRDSNPDDAFKQPDPVHDPARRKFDWPVSDATDRNEEVSAVVPENAVNETVVEITPAAFTNAMTFPELAVAPPLPGAVAGGAL